MTPATIMLVEDNRFSRSTHRFALEKRGHSVVEVGDGASALAMLEAGSIDLILQDLVLPDMDGFELVGRLRALPNGSSASILAFSGMLTKAEEGKVAALGFDDLVVKPIEAARLIPLLEAHLVGPTNRDRIGEGRRLVVADDDPLQLKLTRFRLERLGFIVETAADGEEALDVARRTLPDGIVSDILMPRLDGFGLALAVRKDPRLKHVPVLLVTSSYVDESDRALARSAGASDLVVRTPDQRELTQALRIALHDQVRAVASGPLMPQAIEEARAGRVVHQLERQVTLNTGLAQRCSTLAAELAVLSGVSEALVKHENLELALDETLAACLDVGGIAAGALYLVADEPAPLRVRPLHGSGDIGGLPSFFDNEAKLRSIIGLGRVAVVPSSSFEPSWSAGVLERCKASYAFIVPLGHRTRPLGAFFIAVRGDESAQGDWLLFAQGLGNQVAQALSLARTFDEKETAEQRAREQTLFLQLVLDSIADAVVATDAAGSVVQWNKAAGDLTGLPAHDAIGRSASEVLTLLDEQSRRPAPDPVARALKKAHHELAAPLVLRSRSGRERLVASRGAPIRDADGVVRGTVLAFRDLTEVQAAERALRRSEELFRATFEQAAVGMARVSPEGRWLDVNQRLCEILGYSHSELLGLGISAVTFPEDFEADRRETERALSGETSSFTLQKRYVRRDGEIVWADVARSLVRTATGAPDYFIAIVQDITARKRTEQELELTASQLRHSQKMEALGQLAGGVAHDFNNLLSVIRGHSELLLSDLEAENPARAEVEEIAYACDRAASLTRQLLVLSRKQVLAPRVVDVNESVSGLSKMLRRLIGEDIELKLRLEASGHVHIDPGQLEQVLINLVVNARDAMPGGGLLTIRTEDVDAGRVPLRMEPVANTAGYVGVHISDTGSGISPEVLPQIFEPFFTTKAPGKGTGLGLSTVHGIVKQCGGEIAVSSELGAATTFSIYVPRTERKRVEAARGAAQPSRAQASETVLLVEDESQVRRVLKLLLERAGYTVLEASSGPAALALAASLQTKIDVLLSDVVMPGMNGRELAHRLRAKRPDLRIVLMSGYTDDRAVHREVGMAGMAFLPKPLAEGPLLDTLRDVLTVVPGADAS